MTVQETTTTGHRAGAGSGEAAISVSGLVQVTSARCARSTASTSRRRTGTVLGLLGPNGAGKTTAVRVMTTLLTPDAGEVRVAGLDAVRDAARLRERIGLAGQYAAVDENLTGEENLVMVGRLYGESRRAAKARAGRAARAVPARRRRQAAGQDLLRRHAPPARPRGRARRAAAGALPRRADDGPGPARRGSTLWETIEGLVADGTTVLLTTQYLDEADRLADRIAVIDHGKVIADGTSDVLKEPRRRRAPRGARSRTARARRPRGRRWPRCPTSRSAASGGLVTLTVRRREGAIVEAVRRLDDAGVGVDDLVLRRPTLDDVFLALTGRVAEERDESDEEEAA